MAIIRFSFNSIILGQTRILIDIPRLIALPMAKSQSVFIRSVLLRKVGYPGDE